MLFFFRENISDPAINLAIEEHLLRNIQTEEDILLFYINAPSVIVGRHQNVFEEINLEYAEANKIEVLRRLSGGGAVYHDQGNLNYSIITKKAPENVHNFRKFTEPVAQALNAMGIPATLNQRNDILIHEYKISGNAQYVTTQRMVHHGTLLFNSDLSLLSNVLLTKPQKIESKSIKSVRSKVANIIEFLPKPMDMQTFCQHLIAQLSITLHHHEIPPYTPSTEEWSAINQLANERYRNWEWNYGHSPDSTIHKTINSPQGEVIITLQIQQGIVKSLHLMSNQDYKALENWLTGIRYMRADIAAALRHLTDSQLIPGVSREDLLSALI
ncbi:MAG: lipoate--protein ligase [Anaerolineae bacterium]|nr:lipoate--protein ligase [Anaerolineae bacterium]